MYDNYTYCISNSLQVMAFFQAVKPTCAKPPRRPGSLRFRLVKYTTIYYYILLYTIISYYILLYPIISYYILLYTIVLYIMTQSSMFLCTWYTYTYTVMSDFIVVYILCRLHTRWLLCKGGTDHTTWNFGCREFSNKKSPIEHDPEKNRFRICFRFWFHRDIFVGLLHVFR